MSTLLKAGQRPPMPRVSILPPGAVSMWLHELAMFAPATERLIKDRPRTLNDLSAGTRDGI